MRGEVVAIDDLGKVCDLVLQLPPQEDVWPYSGEVAALGKPLVGWYIVRRADPILDRSQNNRCHLIGRVFRVIRNDHAMPED